MGVDEAFAKLARSKFRSRFRLSAADRKYIADKGMATIRSHAADFVRIRLAPANPPNDGRQTPMRGIVCFDHSIDIGYASPLRPHQVPADNSCHF
jgi:hypothetical protein